MKFISAPWRWDFISTIERKKKCLLCDALKPPLKNSLICHRGEKCFVILNKFPYSTGHLMVVPLNHIASPDKLTSPEAMEIWNLMNRSIQILQDNFHPNGFNIGANVGKCAGAGVKGHFHLHVVPRWAGDSNFMSIIGETRVLSYDMNEILNILKRDFLK